MNTLVVLEWLPSFAVPFLTLSYPTDTPPNPDSFPNSAYYHVGILDTCFVVTCIAVMAILRDVVRLCVLEPFAGWKLKKDLLRQRGSPTPRASASAKQNGAANGETKKLTEGHANGNGHLVEVSPALVLTSKEARALHRSVLRFAEQGWSVIYYICQWSFGLYVHQSLPTKVLDPIDVWINYPHIPLAGPLKFYYLVQTAFYFHQMLILNAEARRKDHWQMMAHHVITVILVIGSYSYNYTRVGCLIMFLMDLCDVFLPLAKMFRYLSLTTLCDATFVCFLLSWFITRHALFIFVIISAYKDAPRLIPRVWDPEHGHYMTKEVYIAYNTLLISLQVLQLGWFWMICRVAWRVISGQNAEDSRSDDEEYVPGLHLHGPSLTIRGPVHYVSRDDTQEDETHEKRKRGKKDR